MIHIPEKFESRMQKMLGSEYPAFYEALTDGTPYAGIRINPLKENSREAVFKAFGELKSVPWCNNGYYTDKSVISGNHPYHAAGLFYFQEPSAMCAASGIPIEEGDHVLDLCAAPGGKSTQAGARLNNTGLLLSNEIIKKRAGILAENIERFGLGNSMITNESPDVLSDKYPEFFNKIIVDAPCSGEGMFRKEEQAITDWSEGHVISCAARQRSILDSAYRMLSPGGMLMYSTCTFSKEENEENVEYMMDKYNMELMRMENAEYLYPSKPEWWETGHDLSEAKRLFPHTHNGEGHFAALLKKPEGTADLQPLKKRTKERGKGKPDPALSDGVALFKAFEKQFLNTDMSGHFIMFGDNLYLMKENINIDKIRVLRPGLHLGICKKGRFEPSHALCMFMAARDFRNCIHLDLNDPALIGYMKGNVIEVSQKGWCAVCAGDYPIGWGKGDGRVLKNHYPKNLRIT